MSQADDATTLAPLDLLIAGFEARSPSSGQTTLWRIGRWLRSQGARRPMSLRVVNAGAVIVDGRILAIDEFGAIQDLSTTRRTPAAERQGADKAPYAMLVKRR